MQQYWRNVSIIIGIFCSLHALTVLAGWALDVPALKAVLPNAHAMKVNSALCLLLAGVSLTLQNISTHQHAEIYIQTAARLCALLALTIATANLLQYVNGYNFGMDEFFIRDPYMPAGLHPGRSSIATSAMFAFAALALCLLPAIRAAGTISLLAQCCVLVTVLISGLGVLGYVIDFELLYAWFFYRTTSLHSSLGAVLIAVGVWAAIRARIRATPERADIRISTIAALCLILAAGATGIASFGTMEKQVKQTLADGLQLALKACTAQVSTNIETRSERAAIITSRPQLLKYVRLLHDAPQNAEYLMALQTEITSFAAHGFSAIIVYNSSGGEVARFGELVSAEELLPLAGEVEAELAWRGGVYFRHRQKLHDAQGVIGTVISEQFLPRITATLLNDDEKTFGSDTELVICRVMGQQFHCLPPQYQQSAIEIQKGRSGDFLLLEKAAMGERGTASALDIHRLRVIGAYDRVGETGLLAILKVNSDIVYENISRSFRTTLQLIAALCFAGTLLIALGVRPLARQLQLRDAQRTAELAQIKSLQAQLQEQATRDPLTGLFNRRYLDETLARELARASRGAQPLSLTMLDLDHFKKLNDHHGHDAGHAMLKALGAMLVQQVRTEDLVCRYGGEEFIIVLPNTTLEQARQRLEQICTVFAESRVAFAGAELQATFSAGVACAPGNGATGAALITAADQMLYAAKAAGRNCVKS